MEESPTVYPDGSERDTERKNKLNSILKLNRTTSDATSPLLATTSSVTKQDLEH